MHTSIRGFHALLAALFLMIVLVVACSPDPTATPVPTNTPVPTATPTPTPTPTPEPTPTPTPEPTPTPAPSTDMMPGMMMDENTMGSDIMAMMSAEEVECVQAAVGDEGFTAMMATPVFLLSDSMAMVADCFAPELSAMLAIAFLSAEVGGLSAESSACLTEFYAEYGATPPDETDPAASLTYLFSFQTCLTDEEAMALSGGDDTIPLPSQLRCLTAQVDQETLTLLLTSFQELFTGSASPELMAAMQEVQIASASCGLDLLSLSG